VEPGVDTLRAAHFADGRFFNPWGVHKAGFRALLRWKLGSRNRQDRSRPPFVPRIANDGASLAAPSTEVEVTWVGHSTFVLQDGGDLLLTDPHFGPRALLPRRFQPPGLPWTAIPPQAVAVLSHNHYDHLDRYTLARLPKGIAWRVPLGLAAFVRSFGYADVEELDWWQESVCRGFRLTLLPAQHWSRRLTQPDETTLWGSWLIESARMRTYFAGDSGYFHGFAEFGRRYPDLDLALLPIGAYEPRWFMKPVHMNPQEALTAFRDLGARAMLPMHWGTFDLTDEAIDEADRVLAQLLLADSSALVRRVHRVAIGQRFAIQAWRNGNG
jgi:N-acyl-phosphatidylethanolamine-hydrolysing phospholipase D